MESRVQDGKTGRPLFSVDESHKYGGGIRVNAGTFQVQFDLDRVRILR